MLTLYNVISADGFIARKDGNEDFIPDSLWPIFLALCKEFGTLIMGRKTYEAIQAYEEELLSPFEALSIRKIVVSNNNLNLKNGYILVNTPENAAALAPNALVSSGPTLNNYLLQKHLVGEIVFHEVPILVKDGIKPFNEAGIVLKKIEDNSYLEGVKVKKYKLE